MPEIGATLREARVRAGIDIAEIESATKIRAKYLRALENDDWEALPGAAYVRSFLRAYAEVVGVDATPLLEQLRLSDGEAFEHESPLPRRSPARPRRERTEDDERRRAGRARASGRPGARPPGNRRLVVLVVAVLLLVVAIVGLASSGGDDGGAPAGGATVVTTPTAQRTTTTASSSPAAARVSLQVVPLAGRPVQVCLVDAAGNRRIDGATLQPGGTQPVYRSKRFKISVGPGGARLVVDGASSRVPAAGAGYLVTAEGRSRLSTSDLPSCGT